MKTSNNLRTNVFRFSLQARLPYLGKFRFWYLWEKPVFSAFFAFCIYTFIASKHQSIFLSSGFEYFNLLAESFLNGQLDLTTLPQNSHDLVLFNGHTYLYWPPFPAILLMPFVAVWGINFSDVLFTVVVAALNVAFVGLLLRRLSELEIILLTPMQRGLLVLFFATGTVHITLAPYGRVWFTAQLLGFFFVTLAYISALSLQGWKSFFFSGLALAAAAATRNHLVFAGIWIAFYLFNKYYSIPKKIFFIYCLVGMLPIILSALLLAGYNDLRFGSWSDVGLDYHQMSPLFVSDYSKYGAFNIHYLPINFYYQYLAYPFPQRFETFMGGSLFLLSPIFFLIFAGIKTAQPRWSLIGLILSILTISIPILLLMGTGWVQFGPRYSLDFTIPLLLLTAYGINAVRWRIITLLLWLSVAHYVAGTFLLMQMM